MEGNSLFMDRDNSKFMPPEAPGVPATSQPSDVTGPSKTEFDALKYIIYGILIVVGLGFIGFEVQSFSASATAFQDLKDQVTAQNAKMDLLIQEYGKK